MSVSLAHLNALLVSMDSAVSRLDQGLPITVNNPRSGETADSAAAEQPAQQEAPSVKTPGPGSPAAPVSQPVTQPHGAPTTHPAATWQQRWWRRPAGLGVLPE